MAPKQPPAEDKGKKLNAGQIALWAQVFPESERVTAVAVALAESGGEYTAISKVNSNGTRDYGVWQINSAHTDLFTKYPDWWTYQNANMAHDVWAAQGWDAWSTYKSKAYVPFIPIATAAVVAPDAGVIGDDPGEDTGATQEAQWFRDTKDAIAQIGNAMAAIAGAVFKSAVWMANPHNWVRAALIGVGGALVVGALVMISKPNTGAVQAVVTVPQQAAKAVQ